MTATCFDGNKQIVLISFAFVPIENEENWKYFLLHISEACEDINKYKWVIASDKEKGK